MKTEQIIEQSPKSVNTQTDVSAEFPNGFESWCKTFYDLSIQLNQHKHPYNSHSDTESFQLAKQWAFEFEKKYKGESWDELIYEEAVSAFFEHCLGGGL